jgi:predicted nucleic acid-binding protein
MRVLYLESSAVVAWLFGEAPAADVRRAMNQAEIQVVSCLTIVEVERVLQRAVAQRVIKEAMAHKLRGELERECANWTTMSLTADVMTRAGRAFPVEPIKTLDAIHLATALAFSESFPDLKILTLDRRVSENATALGLALA